MERELPDGALERVQEWIEYARPDILCMQETKVADSTFPSMALSQLGYESASHADGRWNGVAVASRVGLEDVEVGFAGEADEQGCRLVAATCGGVRVHSVYVPNGRSVGSEHYMAKLEWLKELLAQLARSCGPSDDVAVCGDFNVAPDDRDVWDPAAFKGSTHVSPPSERRLRISRTGVSSTRFACTTGSPTCSPGGTTGRATSTNTSGCGSIWCCSAVRSPIEARTRSSIATPVRASSPRTMRPCSSTWRRDQVGPIAGELLIPRRADVFAGPRRAGD